MSVQEDNVQEEDNVQLGGTAATVGHQTTTLAALQCAPAVTGAVLAPADGTTVKLATSYSTLSAKPSVGA